MLRIYSIDYPHEMIAFSFWLPLCFGCINL